MLNLETILTDPWQTLERSLDDRVTRPIDLYGKERPNSAGVNLTGSEDFNHLLQTMKPFRTTTWQAAPTVADMADMADKKATTASHLSHQRLSVINPADAYDRVGDVCLASPSEIQQSLATVQAFEFEWQTSPIDVRANILKKTADLLEMHRAELFTLLIREAGKTYSNAQNELREAVDFLRYYANQAEKLGQPIPCPGPSGEKNSLQREGLGTFICISPWNFPLAIFTGQIAAALVAGNPVIAKPALETPLIGQQVVELFYQAGLPKEALLYLPAHNSDCDKYLWNSPAIRGVAFTGSTATAKHIQRQLAASEGPIPRFIAETGGINAMIIDSSALLDQAVNDIIISAFDSAGQRCSAARVIYAQEDIYEPLLQLLKGKMATLNVGNPLDPKVDIGPIISERAKINLEQYVSDAERQSSKLNRRLIQSAHLLPPSPSHGPGHFLPPTLIEIAHIDEIGEERFGPILHLISYKRDALAQIIKEINSTGYGLTFGIHTRLDERARRIAQLIQAGNIYINRNTIGAVVETQPFGGRGLSGTGPKAGGPDYLLAFMSSKTISDNISAKGGDPALYNLHL